MLEWLYRRFIKPAKRSAARQDQVDRECDRLILYYFPLCPYCHKVTRVIRRLGLKIEQRNAAFSEQWAKELLDQGGKTQVPCLRIRHSDRDEWLYESDHIIHFLTERFATPEDFPAKTPS